MNLEYKDKYLKYKKKYTELKKQTGGFSKPLTVINDTTCQKYQPISIEPPKKMGSYKRTNWRMCKFNELVIKPWEKKQIMEKLDELAKSIEESLKTNEKNTAIQELEKIYQFELDNWIPFCEKTTPWFLSAGGDKIKYGKNEIELSTWGWSETLPEFFNYANSWYFQVQKKYFNKRNEMINMVRKAKGLEPRFPKYQYTIDTDRCGVDVISGQRLKPNDDRTKIEVGNIAKEKVKDIQRSQLEQKRNAEKNSRHHTLGLGTH